MQLHRATQRRDRFDPATGLAMSNSEFHKNRRGVLLLLCERFENFEGPLRPAGAAVRGTEYEASLRLAGEYAENLVRLFRGEFGTRLEQSLRMGERDVDTPNPL